MRRNIVRILLLLAMSVTAQAQNGSVKITLRSGDIVTYTDDMYDSVRIVKTLSLNDEVSVGVKVYLTGKKSVDYIAVKAEINKPEPPEPDDNNKNRNKYRGKLLEYPHLSTDSVMNLLIIKETSDYGITFSLEWDCNKKANRWTCYEMHDGNNMSNVSRKDDFKEDPDIPSQYRTTLNDYKSTGFSRGHLCPSSDRLCSREQNSQTFYLSNMQPQWQAHNGGLWNNLEALVRKWDDTSFRDTLYVVKAATIDDANIKQYTSTGLIVPKYFYMAILCVKNHEYKAIGLWTEHKNESDTNKNYGDYAINIDELEKRTGIDFFCNLPDDIEEQVESQVTDDSFLNLWGISKTK
ncbi:MAG: DNA/RNA non-specific endonuclease [Prevotella sp.]|nr:DNA/RNA non-specific endonuclease [Prevotella sp.]